MSPVKAPRIDYDDRKWARGMHLSTGRAHRMSGHPCMTGEGILILQMVSHFPQDHAAKGYSEGLGQHDGSLFDCTS